MREIECQMANEDEVKVIIRDHGFMTSAHWCASVEQRLITRDLWLKDKEGNITSIISAE